MIYINHRINTIAQLAHVPSQQGIELDIRYHENELILHHDPFHHHENCPENFETLLEHWQHDGIMVLNIKTEGIEEKCIALMNQYGVKDWFFLDLSMPYFVVYADLAVQGEYENFGPENLAVRFSDREPISYTIAFAGKVKWVWVDCFDGLAIDRAVYQQLKDAGFKICLVSPELQNHSIARISHFQKNLTGLKIDAVCTKQPNVWAQVDVAVDCLR